MKPKMLYLYDYEMHPWQSRVPFAMPYLLEQALKEYFDVFRLGELPMPEADVVFNTQPMITQGGVGEDLFQMGHKTFFWNQTPLESPLQQYADASDIVFCGTPGFVSQYGKKGRLLLPALIPHYNEYPTDKLYDVGFLGSEVVAWRIDLLNELARHFKLLRTSTELGEPSARLLSQCKLVLSVEDWHHHNASIEFRIWSHGNVRPILMHYNKDLDIIGKKYEHYIPYQSAVELIEQINYYLENMEEAEAIGENWKKELAAKHTYHNRAEEVFKAFNE